jgi:HPt (histidine-containing phosphotransfer) domain-containing protein
MDNFVSKPFRAEELFQAVEGVPAEVLGERLIDDSGGPAPLAGHEPCLDWQDSLRNLEGDEGFLYELSEMFLAQCPALLAAVEEAVAREDGDELRRAAHSLKGSSQVIGGQATAATSLLLEQLGRDGDFGEAVPALHGLRANVAELKVALLAALEKRDS